MPYGLLGLPSPIAMPDQTWHPEAADWYRRVSLNGGTVSLATMRAVSKFCTDIDAAGLRDRFFRLSLMAGSNLSSCLVPLYRGPFPSGTQYGNASDTNNNFVSGDYVETGQTGGLKGDGSTKYLDTGFVCTTLPFCNAHLSAYIRTAASSGTYSPIVAAFQPPNNLEEFAIYSNGGTVNSQAYYSDDNTANGYVVSAANNPTGFFLGTAVSVPDRRCYLSGAQSISTTTTAPSRTNYPNFSLFVLCRNTNGGGAQRFNNARVCGYSIGLGLRPPQVSLFNTAMQTFQASLGRNA